MTSERIPARYEPGEFLPVLQALAENERTLIAVKSDLRTRNPTWAEGVDARLTVFAKCVNVTQPTFLALAHIHHHLVSPSWWMERLQIDLSKRGDELQIYLLNYSEFVKAAYLHQSFSATESALRVFLRALDAAACDGGTAEFKSIYDALLNKVLPGDADSQALLDLLRLTRNTVHNQGVFFHRRLRKVELLYRGRKYEFRHGERVTFATWPLVVSLMRDLGELLTRVVTSPTISSIAAPIVERAFI